VQLQRLGENSTKWGQILKEDEAKKKQKADDENSAAAASPQIVALSHKSLGSNA
jgi:hypothetical protein